MSEENDNPIGMIFNEIDQIATDIDAILDDDSGPPRIDRIRNVLDEWVRQRVVRMSQTRKFNYSLEGPQDLLGEKIDMFQQMTKHSSQEFIDMCATTKVDGQEITMAFYLLAFKENF